jgi:hypothetical protein
MQALGATLGDHLIPGEPAVNDKGFWEDREINAFNNALLTELDSSWDSAQAIDARAFEFPRILRKREEAARLLEQKVAEADLFAFKDPRMSLLLQFWQPVFSELGLRVRYLISVRNPLEVAASLRQRDDFSEIKSLLLWARYSTSCINDTDGELRAFVSYESLIQSPERELTRIASLLTLAPPLPDETRQYTQEFLSQGLRHHEYSVEALENIEKYPPLFCRLYKIMRDAASDEVEPQSSEWAQRWQDIVDQFESSKSLFLHFALADAKAREAETRRSSTAHAAPATTLARRLALSRAPMQARPRALISLHNLTETGSLFPKLVFRWNLESINEGKFIECDDDRPILCGWVLGTSTRPVHVAIRQNGSCRSYALNEERPDVVESVRRSTAGPKEDLLCGFRISADPSTELDFGFEVDGRIAWAYHMVVSQ